MTRSIAEAVAELKSGIRESLSPQTIELVCERAGHRWRVRTLDPVRTIWMFALQVVHGFPIATIVALFHRSGLLVDMLIEPLYCHESRLAHKLFKWLRRNDLLVGDPAFASYVNLATLHERDVEAVMRQHQRRPVDLRRGRRIAQEDQIIEWTRPPPEKAPKAVTVPR